MASNTYFLDLPVDVLLLVFPYLDATSFLHLTSTCKALHTADFIYDPSYWSSLVRTSFRVPMQPVVQQDGKRWQKLYRRMLTQSRIYTWGNNEKACLGHSYEDASGLVGMGPPGLRRVRALRKRHISWPAEMEAMEGLGVVSDVQCGGWSTTMLTAKGALYSVGVLNGLQFDQAAHTQPTPLIFPPGFASTPDRHEPSTAIRQFSAGRTHVLGLSDSGRIWSWQNIERAALYVRFMHHDTNEQGQSAGRGTIHKVVAGWNKSSALIEGTGILIWHPPQRRHDEPEIQDVAIVTECAVIPKTSYRQPKGKGRRQAVADSTENAALAESVGEVLNYIVLEDVIIFNTHLGKVFAVQIDWEDNQERLIGPIELRVSSNISGAETRSAADPDAVFVTDVQGSFRSFAIFTHSGEILISNQDHVRDVLRSPSPTEQPLTVNRIPALQHRDVISVAFGDYHFHALHSTGHITSYGNEPQACGALGLGGHGDPEGRLRGIRYQGIGGDARLIPHAYTEGRRVWFEDEKKDWVKFLTAGGHDPAEAAERMRMALGSPDMRCQGEVSEWIEQEGRDWEGKFGLRSEDDDGFGAYFALSVTAAGWHSGALVLVNEDLVRRVTDACAVRDPSLPPAEPATTDDEDTSVSAASSSFLAWAVSIALDYGRWFLGIAPYNVSQHPQPLHADDFADTENATIEQIHHPRSYGDSPREGYKYVWAYDHFPRLKLSNGEEMPGKVEFAEWRFGRPEFNLRAGP